MVRGREDHRAVKLLVRGIKIAEKLKNLFLNLFKTGVGLVYLIYNNDYTMIHLQSLAKHEASLGHGALRRVNQQNYTVYHLQNTLDLTAKVRMAGGVDDVNLNVAVMNCGIFRQNGDSALSFKVVAVHYALCRSLIFTVDTALLQHFVNKCGLSVVNVSNNGNIS